MKNRKNIVDELSLNKIPGHNFIFNLWVCNFVLSVQTSSYDIRKRSGGNYVFFQV